MNSGLTSKSSILPITFPSVGMVLVKTGFSNSFLPTS
jgi:hypothetical protein